MLATMPMHLWCQLLPKIKCQFLLLCQSKANPNILAYAHVYGHHDYNYNPFVPIGMEALPLKNQFVIWWDKFPLQIKLIFVLH